jgi:hypothetical protein
LSGIPGCNWWRYHYSISINKLLTK